MDNLNKIEEYIVNEEFIMNKGFNNRNIVVIGNGFDMSLGLKSSYQNFIEYIKHKKKFDKDYDLYNYNRLFLRKYENFHLNWSDFESLYEEIVRRINNRSQKSEELQDILDITSINNAIKRLEEDFTEYLSEEYSKWVEQRTTPIGPEFKKITENINPFFEKLIKDENTYFINFNYTSTIADMCESILYDSQKIKESSGKLKKAKDRVFHIHGSLEEENILFGGGFTDSEDINEIHYSQSLINDKLFRIKENELLNATRKQIMSIAKSSNEKSKNDLFIIGHSLQGSDFLFLSKLIKEANKVFIFYYEDDYIFKMEEILRKFGSTVAEKIVLVPFLEVLLQPNKSIISNYKEYQKIDSCFSNKFPKEDILSELTLTIDHFSFRNINELRIKADNVEMILQIARSLVVNKNPFKITKIYFEESIDAIEFNKLSNSKDFLALLKWVEKIKFYNTEIDAGFFIHILENSSNLVSISMEECTLISKYNENADVSKCESLKKLEIIDCSFTLDSPNERKGMFYVRSDKNNNIEKLVVLRNSNIVFNEDVLEKSMNLIELNISITNDENVYSKEVHLKNLEILQMDYTSGKVPSLTVGNNIMEVNLIGYTEEFIKLSSFLKSNDASVGFPKLKLFHLKFPDQMNSCQNIIIDVILDVFSNNAKFIVDKDIKSIKEYYSEHKEQHIQIFNNYEELVDDNILLEFENLSLELSRLKKYSVLEELLEQMNMKLKEEIQNFGQMESKDINDSNKKNESDLEQESITNEIDTPINSLLYAHLVGDKAASLELIKTLEKQNKTKTVIDVYRKILTEIENAKSISQKDIPILKNEFFIQTRNEIIKDFSEKWSVSEEELVLSAIQYVDGAKDIPNIGNIIDSKDFKSYRVKHSGANPIKYAQAIKQGWQKELDEKIVYLNNELK
ncbi:AbiH family protein [Bacillus tropicus]|nr:MULTISPECIES: AbiH family protein [Bacillus]ALL22550.1 magnesium transporter [Bacillus thuringiensis]EEM24034.1 Magnesium transporter [Bacillus thuringiensis serovar tochigiensis BGSC 4Y1]MCB4846861.1 bacteriophage abortive infection AbiH family protein [Bacillus tropicus]UBM52272.1 bacteriophage abortive infection AbiH family protein [Bacillus sp. CRB-7]